MLRTEFQYFRDEKRRPLITVCYLRDEKHTYIGVAVCSKHDAPCKEKGRYIARGRALEAMRVRRNGKARVGTFLGRSSERVARTTDSKVQQFPRYLFVEYGNDYRFFRKKMQPRHNILLRRLTAIENTLKALRHE